MLGLTVGKQNKTTVALISQSERLGLIEHTKTKWQGEIDIGYYILGCVDNGCLLDNLYLSGTF